MSKNLMIVMIIEYAGLLAASLFDRNIVMALYWAGAVVLNVAVLLMGYKK